jgi:ABC-type dipeptide/oligopeptide/nickel transport system ATPase subunit
MKLETTNEGSEIAGLVPTKSFVKASQLIKRAVAKNTMLAISGEAGIGKSTVREISIGRYSESFDRYVIIKPEAGIVYSQVDKTASIISMMIEKLSSIKPARDVVKRIDQLNEALKFNRTKKIILVIDEAQDLSQTTMYGLKKIHELNQRFKSGASFSILLFGKPSLKSKLNDYELGYRIEQYSMQSMDKEEMKAFLNNKKVKFKMDRLYESFYQSTKGLPLSAKKTVDEIFRISKERKLDYDHSFSFYLTGDLSKSARDAGISNNDISKFFYKKFGKHVDPSTVHKANKGILNTHLAGEIRDFTEGLIQNKEPI